MGSTSKRASSGDVPTIVIDTEGLRQENSEEASPERTLSPDYLMPPQYKWHTTHNQYALEEEDIGTAPITPQSSIDTTAASTMLDEFDAEHGPRRIGLSNQDRAAQARWKRLSSLSASFGSHQSGDTTQSSSSQNTSTENAHVHRPHRHVRSVSWEQPAVAPSDAQSSTSPSVERPEIKRNRSSQFLRDVLTSTTNLFTRHHRAREDSLSQIPARSRTPNEGPVSSQASTTADIPRIRAMMKRDSVPDLEDVTEALAASQVALDESDGNISYTAQLSEVAAQLNDALELCRCILEEASLDRDQGKIECCRAKCVLLVRCEYADVETRVFAYNVLAGLASAGQAERYLDDAQAVVEGLEAADPNRADLMGIINGLREGARAKDLLGERCSNTNGKGKDRRR